MKALRIFLFILIVIGIILLLTQKLWVPKLVDQILQGETIHVEKETPSPETKKTATAISISTQNIKEENFTGTMPVISGTSQLAKSMREYAEKRVAEFRKLANDDVPDIREKFGADNPTANYTIDISSKYVKGGKTESIVTNIYTYTGGAHGSATYKVITANISDGKILPLSSAIKAGEQKSFTDFVKKQLNDWRPEGGNASPVFPDEVKNLTFNSFSNWSLDDKNLIIYFDQYAIGPGVLGSVAFPLPIERISNFLQSF
jgi:hypothetical protein